MTKKESNSKTVAENRKAKFNYEFLERFEAGIVLTGTEVKSLRVGGANIMDAFAEIRNGEVLLINADIPVLKTSRHFTHEPRRPRNLLLNKKQIKKLIGKLKDKGLSLVAVHLYFNLRGLAKVDLALGKGKKQYEKRESIKERDWGREKERIFKNK